MYMDSKRNDGDVGIIVRTLLGEDGVEVALKCLGSLCQQVQGTINLVLHDDGSLHKESIEELRSRLPIERVIGREEADERVLQKLRSYPRCREYRRRSNFALKLFDVPLLSTEKRIAFSDSDILFVKPVEGLFELQGRNAKFSANGHMGNAYSVSFTQVEPLGHLRLVDSLNSGLFCLDRACYDLGFIEETLDYLSRSRRFEERPYWAEQTCWSAVAAEIGASLWRFEDISIPEKKAGKVTIPEDALALHFASSVREALWDVYPETNEVVSRPRTTKPEYNTSFQQLKFDLGIYVSSILDSFLGK